MLRVAIVCALLGLPLIIKGLEVVEPSSTTTPLIIEGHGYPVENHTVTTIDGYILTMHRIPYSSKTGKTGNGGSPRPVAFLMHGLLGSSSDWILNGPDKALAYVLSDNGFDVWMGNARGNTYSRRHTTKNPSNRDFWDFNWHDIAVDDLPAMITYVTKYTGQPKVSYIGHSQGTTAFLVLNSMNGKSKDLFNSAHLLAPVAYMKHSESPIVVIGGKIFGNSTVLAEQFGNTEFLPSSRAPQELGCVACTDTTPLKELCAVVLSFILGNNSPYFNGSMIPDILATSPSGSSTNQLIHYFQLHESGRFCQFDYGIKRNIDEYKRWTPPEYDLGSIDVPMYIYYSDGDQLVSVADVKKLISGLNPSTIVRDYRMPETEWSHGDFLYGINATELLYNLILEDIVNGISIQ